MSHGLSHLVRSLVAALVLVLGTGTGVLAQRVNANWSGVAVKGYDVVAYCGCAGHVGRGRARTHQQGDANWPALSRK